MPLDRKPLDEARLEALVGKAVGELSAAYGGVMIDLGTKLGLFRAMAGAGPMTSAEVARAAGCAERYVREWLNAQAAGGWVDYHPASRTYELTPEQAAVLCDEASPVNMSPAWDCVAALWAGEERAIHAFRTGEGVPWGDHDGRLFCGVASFYRNGYRANCRAGCRRSTAWWRSSRRGQASPTSAAATGTRR
jgi:hypothetical protein